MAGIPSNSVLTPFDSIKIDDFVNIERACQYGEEVGGHEVTGHVDCTGLIKEIIITNNNRDIVVSCDKKWIAYLFPKGWITIDGISLTVVEVGDSWFSISIIPETLKNTTMGCKIEGDNVNLEFEQKTKIIVQSIERMIPKIKKQIMHEIID